MSSDNNSDFILYSEEREENHHPQFLYQIQNYNPSPILYGTADIFMYVIYKFVITNSMPVCGYIVW